MRVRHVQHARIAEFADVVELVAFGGAADARNDACNRRGGKRLQHVAATHYKSLLRSASDDQRITALGQSFSCSLACAIERVGERFGVLRELDRVVELAGVAAAFAFLKSAAVVVHSFLSACACFMAASALASAALAVVGGGGHGGRRHRREPRG